MKKQNLRMEVKEISADGSFEGLLSVYGNVDQGKDAVIAGAFTKTIQERGSVVPLLWQHKSDTPIGTLTLEDTPSALKVTGQLLMELPEAQKAYLLIKARIVKGLSIGFETIKDSMDGAVRKLLEVRLFEGSIVTFPMNEMALITSVKGKLELKGDFNEELTELQLSDAGSQMRCALSAALSSLFWSGLKKEEIVTASETIIQQFSDAYMAYVPAYIDMLTERYGDLEMWAKGQMEQKAGRKISAATKKDLKSAHEQMKSATDILYALIDDEAGDDDPEDLTSKAEAATEQKSKPAIDHLAAESLLQSMRSLIPAAR